MKWLIGYIGIVLLLLLGGEAGGAKSDDRVELETEQVYEACQDFTYSSWKQISLGEIISLTVNPELQVKEQTVEKGIYFSQDRGNKVLQILFKQKHDRILSVRYLEGFYLFFLKKLII